MAGLPPFYLFFDKLSPNGRSTTATRCRALRRAVALCCAYPPGRITPVTK
jgi:hypothetical protein